MAADPKRVKEVFMAAADVPATGREAFLDRECGDDADLRQRVEVLLRAHEEPGSFLRQPAEPGTAAFHSDHGLALGQMFAGRFKLREELGEGGMGVVFVADQTEPIQRRVALKVIRGGADSSRVLARFEQERQALAMMDHPNIAKVLDAGISESGQPYFVMELIKGVPLTEYCDDAKLATRERLELFIPVCQAVQHAHQKGIIHRDLKPSNILVGLYDGKPVPKVIDFGVAKATGPRLSEHTVYTEVGSVIGTFEYMSPEQAELNNLDIDTRSDIYALGVILYELLTGTVPFSRKELQATGFAEMLRIIKEKEPPRPSTRLSQTGELPSVAARRHTEPAKLYRLLRGDLDWITMKALEKDRSRRYETANGFAMDVQRYLDGEQVLAVPPSAGYRLRKFARKYRTALATAAAFAGLLVLAAGVSAWQAWRATRAEAQARAERDAAQAARERADRNFALAKEAVDKYLGKVTDHPKLVQGDFHQLRTELLETAVPFYQQFADQESQDPDLRAARGNAYLRLANLRSVTGERVTAVIHFRQALELQEQLVAEFPAVAQYRRSLARSHAGFGTLLATLDKGAEAEDHFRKAIAMWTQLAVDFPAPPEYRLELANSHNSMGILLNYPGERRDEAVAQYRQALALREKLAAEFPTEAAYHRDVAGSMNNIANIFRWTSRRSEAMSLYEQAIRHQERALERDPQNVTSLSYLAHHQQNLGVLLADLGRGDEAETRLHKSVDLREKLAADFPSVAEYVVDRGMVYVRFGYVVRNNGRLQDSLDWYARALAVLEPMLDKEPRLGRVRKLLSDAHWGRAWVLDRNGRHADAILIWGQALSLDDGENRPVLQLGRAISQAHVSGDHAKALAEAEVLAKGRDASTLEGFARQCALASAAGGEQYAARAVEFLSRAVRQGYRDSLYLQEGVDLKALRGRADFQNLLNKSGTNE